MESSIGELATDSSQPCRHGRNRGKVTALEAVYEGCRCRQEILGSPTSPLRFQRSCKQNSESLYLGRRLLPIHGGEFGAHETRSNTKKPKVE